MKTDYRGRRPWSDNPLLRGWGAFRGECNQGIQWFPSIFWIHDIPAEAIHPLSDAWDILPCPICEEHAYRLHMDLHLATHRYREPLWLRFLRWVADRPFKPEQLV